MKTNGGIERPGPSILGAIGEAALSTPLPSPRCWTPKPFAGKIKLGTFYEINHSKLPTTAPRMLRSIRVVLATAKTETYVTVRYPSTKSLESYFESVDFGAIASRLYPSLDEKFVMGPILAVEVLGRVISSEEFGEHKHAKSFWLIDCLKSDNKLPSPVSVCDVAIPREVKKGPLLLDLQSQLKGWGSHRVVAYLPDSGARPEERSVRAHSEERSVRAHSEETSARADSQEMIVNAHQEEDKKDVKKEEETTVIKDRMIIPYTRKRKRGLLAAEETKKVRDSPKAEPVECKAIIKGNSQSYVQRWLAKRYEAAARQLCEVLEANRAVYGSPISRFELRAQARTRIGDTGLLDHLLKHLAGKVIPGGDKRLRRRCDADGKMEYWLESADLAQIRKEAGVQDPYWTPPPGWKPGDCVGPQGCLCGEERKKHKEEVSTLKRQIEALKSKNVVERAIALVRQDSSASFERQNSGGMRLTGSKPVKYKALLKKKSLMEQQLVEISKALMGVEEDVKMLLCSYKEEPMNKNLLTEHEHQSEAAEAVSDDAEVDGEERSELRLRVRLRVRKLKPCENQDSLSSSPSNHKEDYLALTAADWTPESTTTSLTTH